MQEIFVGEDLEMEKIGWVQFIETSTSSAILKFFSYLGRQILTHHIGGKFGVENNF